MIIKFSNVNLHSLKGVIGVIWSSTQKAPKFFNTVKGFKALTMKAVWRPRKKQQKG